MDGGFPEQAQAGRRDVPFKGHHLPRVAIRVADNPSLGAADIITALVHLFQALVTSHAPHPNIPPRPIHPKATFNGRHKPSRHQVSTPQGHCHVQSLLKNQEATNTDALAANQSYPLECWDLPHLLLLLEAVVSCFSQIPEPSVRHRPLCSVPAFCCLLPRPTTSLSCHPPCPRCAIRLVLVPHSATVCHTVP